MICKYVLKTQITTHLPTSASPHEIEKPPILIMYITKKTGLFSENSIFFN